MRNPSGPASSLAQLHIGPHPDLLLDATHAVTSVTLNVAVHDASAAPPPSSAAAPAKVRAPGGVAQATATMRLDVEGDPLLLRQLTRAALEGTLLYVRYSPDGAHRGGRKLTGQCRVTSITAVSSNEAPFWVDDVMATGDGWREDSFDLTFPAGLTFDWHRT